MKRVYIPLQTDIVLLEAQHHLAASINREGNTATVEFDETEYNGSFGSRRKRTTWDDDDDDGRGEENYQ